jgi:hypothetical protein
MKYAICAIGTVCMLSMSISIGHAEDDPLGDLLDVLGDLIVAVGDAVFDAALAIRIRLAIDYSSEITRPFILSCIRNNHYGYYNMAQVCDMWSHCYNNWGYVSDPYATFDSFYSSSDTIRAGLRGDCDDFAILVAAGVRVIGGSAMVRAEQSPEGGHAYTLVYIGSDDETIAGNLVYVMARYNVTLEEAKHEEIGWLYFTDWGYWLNLDWFANHPGSPLWTKRSHVTVSNYLPTPSVLGFLITPILNAPYTSFDYTINEFGIGRVRRALGLE